MATGQLRRVSILTGHRVGLFSPQELVLGANGGMARLNVTAVMVDVCRAHAAGRMEHAFGLFDADLLLARYEQQKAIGLAVPSLCAVCLRVKTWPRRRHQRTCRPGTAVRLPGRWGRSRWQAMHYKTSPQFRA